MSDLITLLIMLMLLLISSFYSGSETALLSVNKFDVKQFLNERKRNAEIIQKLKNNQRRTLVSLLIANNTLNILASSLAASMAIRIFGDLGVGIATFFLTITIIIGGEIIPKTYCSRNYKEVIVFLAPLIYFTERILSPVVAILDFFISKFTKERKIEPLLTEKELKSFFEVGVQEKVLEPQERVMFEKILIFNDMAVDKILTPVRNIIFLNGNSTLLHASKIISKQRYSRFPVFKNNKQNVIGIVRGVDVLSSLSRGEVATKVKHIMWAAEFVRNDELIDDVFLKFKKNRVHMGIVKDKEGKVIGLVTLEDIIEEIVGEFGSEDD